MAPGEYHLYGAHLDDAMIMDHRPGGWVVFYSERGGEYSAHTHETEAEACADLLQRVTGNDHAFFQLVAGPAPASDADRAFDVWLRERGATRGLLAAEDWKYDDVPCVPGPYWRRYFVRITAARDYPKHTDLPRSARQGP
jgi:hypothetical protein